MIVRVPNQVLTTPAKKVGKIDKKVTDIIGKMKKNLLSAENPKGVGLAAPQIGESLQIFITRPTEKSPISVYLDPEVVWKSEDTGAIVRPEDGTKTLRKEKKLEGCLSIPNVWGYLKRPKSIRLRYLSATGTIKEEVFKDFVATIIQHETDHVNGIMFTQRVLEQKEKLYRIEEDENGKEELIEIEI